VKDSALGEEEEEYEVEPYFLSTKLQTRMMAAVVRVKIRMKVRGRIAEGGGPTEICSTGSTPSPRFCCLREI